jgi:aspartyl-tRNA(Asn)/glutamyl-tRNA(Gln) amidotransferase subunit C
MPLRSVVQSTFHGSDVAEKGHRPGTLRIGTADNDRPIGPRSAKHARDALRAGAEIEVGRAALAGPPRAARTDPGRQSRQRGSRRPRRACAARLNRGCCYAAKRNSGRAMSIESATVRHIARLARLAIDDSELASTAAELGRVLDLADRLAAADIAGVEPMAHPHEQTLVWRADAVTEDDRADALLALAPEARGGYFLVPKVIE